MKKGWVVGVIVGLHCLIVGALFLSQGCGTTPKQAPGPAAPVIMPPPVEPVQPLPTVKAPPLLPPAPIEMPPAAMETKTYVVKAGDNLSFIAKRFNVTTRDLMAMNKLTATSKLKVGQKLMLPGYVDLNAPAPVRKHKAPVVKKAPGVKVPAAAGEYVVKSGDSLGKIAANHGTTVKAIKAANQLTSDNLRIGQKLVLSGADGSSTKEESVAAPAGEAAAPVETPAVVETPAATGSVPDAGPAKSEGIMHRVEPGEDLSTIAMMYGVRVEDIVKLNAMTNAQATVGQMLKIPPAAEL